MNLFPPHGARWWLLTFAIACGLRAADEAPVALPPFLVEEAQKGPPWRYAEAMGYEILSRCGDGTTRRVVEAHYQLHQLLAELLPPSLQLTMTVPPTLILYDEELQPAASKEVIARMLRSSGPNPPAEEFSPMAGMRGIRPPTTARFTFLPNLRLWDRDAMTIFMIVRDDGFSPDRLALTQDYVTFLVKGRLPTLPVWFVSGFLAMHRQTTYGGRELTVAKLEWPYAMPAAAGEKEAKAPPPIPSLPDFFAGRVARPPVGESAAPPEEIDPLQRWQAQSALFVRWGLSERDRGRRAGFWKFVEQSAARGVTEELFVQCLGIDFATATRELTAFLPGAVAHAVHYKPARMAKLPAYPIVNASPAQIARIKGDWERLEVPYVRAISAELAPKYLEQARRTLLRAYDRDERDPRLLAVMGLCECDAGNADAARAYLESAVQIGPLRPRACYELARLRFAEVCAHPAAGERLSIAQISPVLEQLFAARAQQPPLPEVYELIADVWTRAAATATRRHLAVLDEGVQLFPRRTALALHAAELNLRFGFRDEAAALVAVAVRSGNTDDAIRSRISALLAQLETK